MHNELTHTNRLSVLITEGIGFSFCIAVFVAIWVAIPA